MCCLKKSQSDQVITAGVFCIFCLGFGAPIPVHDAKRDGSVVKTCIDRHLSYEVACLKEVQVIPQVCYCVDVFEDFNSGDKPPDTSVNAVTTLPFEQCFIINGEDIGWKQPAFVRLESIYEVRTVERKHDDKPRCLRLLKPHPIEGHHVSSLNDSGCLGPARLRPYVHCVCWKLHKSSQHGRQNEKCPLKVSA